VPANLIDRQVAKLGRLYGPRLLKAVSVASESDLQPTLTRAVLAAYGISAVIFASSIALGLLGAYLITSGWPQWLSLLGGAVCLAIAFVLRPRFPKKPSDCLSRSSCPALFGLVDRVAEQLSSKPVDFVRVDEEFNASMSAVGVQRQSLLTLGLPFWAILAPQERVALVAHEMAHRINGDPGRSFIIGNALMTLGYWRYFLTPDSHGDYDFWQMIAHIPVRIIGLLVGGLEWVLRSLLYIDSQRAEYLADFLAAKVAGGPAVTSLLHKLGLSDNLAAVADRVYYQGDTEGRTLIGAFRSFADQVPESEMERIKRINNKEESRIDASHPPTAYRIQFIVVRAVSAPARLLSDAESADIDRELQSLSERYSMKIMDRLHSEA
jgi:heat shock protein HtpX